MRWTPSLNDPLVGNQFYITSNEQAAERGQGASRFRVDVGRHPGARGELLGIEKHFIDALRACPEIDFLVKRSAGAICHCAGRFLHLLRLPPDLATRGKSSKRNGSPGDGLPAGRGRIDRKSVV